MLLFSGLTKPNINKLIKNSKFVNCIKDSIVQSEGTPVDRVYIIRSGEFQVTQTFYDTSAGDSGANMTGLEYR